MSQEKDALAAGEEMEIEEEKSEVKEVRNIFFSTRYQNPYQKV
jgi:hypothetical protein